MTSDRSISAAERRSHWTLDPSVTYLNHGSFGACPAAVLAAQADLRREMEREPVDFLDGSLPARLEAARVELSAFVGAEPADLVFVPNATTGVNAVLRSLRFEPGEEILVTDHTYAACRKSADFVARRAQARIVVAGLPFPVETDEQILAAVMNRVSPRTRLALLDHVSSPTPLILPVAGLVRELRGRGVERLVDGAHAPGLIPLELSKLGADYYTGNAHKWLCAPKGAAFLHVRADRQGDLHPTVISHGYPSGFRAEFDWTGTCDPTPWLCIPAALRAIGSLLHGGWSEVMARNRALVLEARALLLTRLGVAAPCPAHMLGAMASIPLPAPASAAARAAPDTKAIHHWLRTRGIEAWLYPEPVPLLRISAQLYNNLDQYQRLATLLLECMHGR